MKCFHKVLRTPTGRALRSNYLGIVCSIEIPFRKMMKVCTHPKCCLQLQQIICFGPMHMVNKYPKRDHHQWAIGGAALLLF